MAEASFKPGDTVILSWDKQRYEVISVYGGSPLPGERHYFIKSIGRIGHCITHNIPEHIANVTLTGMRQ